MSQAQLSDTRSVGPYGPFDADIWYLILQHLGLLENGEHPRCIPKIFHNIFMINRSISWITSDYISIHHLIIPESGQGFKDYADFLHTPAQHEKLKALSHIKLKLKDHQDVKIALNVLWFARLPRLQKLELVFEQIRREVQISERPISPESRRSIRVSAIAQSSQDELEGWNVIENSISRLSAKQCTITGIANPHRKVRLIDAIQQNWKNEMADVLASLPQRYPGFRIPQRRARVGA